MTDSKKSLVARVKEAVHRRSFFGKIAEIADNRRHNFNTRVGAAKHRVAGSESMLERLREHGASRQRLEDEQQVLSLDHHVLKRMRAKRNFWRKRYHWTSERHEHWGLVWKHRRDRLRRWIAQHEGFQPYMANGNPHEKLTPEARYAIYLDFRDGLYVTSTYEGYPGDGVHSTGSLHYLENQPDGKGRCWDAGAGSSGPMVKAQRREAARCPSYMIELIGPDNECEYKNGIRYSLPEGSVLETMHDNHKHQCIRDGAPIA